MSEGTAQIYEPQTGRSYRVHWKKKTFIVRVVGWDTDTVDVVVINDCGEAVAGSINMKRLDARFEEWLEDKG